MKKIILLVFILMKSLNCFSQCIADAGNDQHWCRDNIKDTIILGGFPSAGNGTLPYTYTWSTDPIQLSSNLSFYASNFLDDTTKANPSLIDFWNSAITFFLEVKDSDNIICRDTVKITVSQFSISLVTYYYYINAGDSVRLKIPNAGPSSSLMPPIDSILWRPHIGITDSNAARPWVQPNEDVVYYPIVWDSAGCRAEGPPFQYVYVCHIGIDEISNPLMSEIKVYPTALSKDNESLYIEIPFSFESMVFRLYDLNGKEVISQKFASKEFDIKLEHLIAGVYFYVIEVDKKIRKYGKINKY